MNLNWKKKNEIENDLDKALMSPMQREMSRLVRELPEDVPSLSWRSDLNEKLRMHASKVRRKKILTNWVLRPALGLGLASAAAVFMLSASSPKTAAKADRGADVADAIVRTYSDEVQNRDVMLSSFPTESAPASHPSDAGGDPYAQDVTDSI